MLSPNTPVLAHAFLSSASGPSDANAAARAQRLPGPYRRPAAADESLRLDPLTGLSRRFVFEQRLERAVDEVQLDSRRSHVLLVLGLDEFRRVNEACGYAGGDALLRSVATTLRTCIRFDDLLSRLGADRFAALLRDCRVDQAPRVAHSLRRSIEGQPFSWKERTIPVRASMGIVAVRQHEYAASLLQCAEAACRAARSAGGSRVRVFGESRDCDSDEEAPR